MFLYFTFATAGMSRQSRNDAEPIWEFGCSISDPLQKSCIVLALSVKLVTVVPARGSDFAIRINGRTGLGQFQ